VLDHPAILLIAEAGLQWRFAIVQGMAESIDVKACRRKVLPLWDLRTGSVTGVLTSPAAVGR
jgi:hypothetical protein